MKRVMNGERNLTAEMVERYAEVIGLDAGGTAYFAHLVRFNDAPSVKERERAYEQLSTFLRYQHAQRLDVHQAAYFSTWYIPVIREMIACDDFQNDPAWIAKRLRPAITARKAKRAIKVLLELGLVQENDEGQLETLSDVVSTRDSVAGEARADWVHLRRYHRAMIESASASLDLFSSSERSVAAVTLAVAPDDVGALRERLEAFRKELLGRFDSPGARQVMQVNFQLFPVADMRDQ